MNDSRLPYDRGMPPTGHHVSLERLEEFRRIYKEVYGEEITSAEASAMTHPLLALYRLLSQPLPGGGREAFSFANTSGSKHSRRSLIFLKVC
jgi:hypothetical protein